ncbi:MAG: hypothetical protein ACJ74Y_18535 [Bryobacteraceae bacterium]
MTQRTIKVTTPLARKELLKTNPVQQDRDAQRYQLLRDYLLRNRIIRQVALSTGDSEPFVMGATFFVMGATFYGQTFEQAVDTLEP